MLTWWGFCFGVEYMPRRPKKPCAYPGCPELIEAGQRFCEKHEKQEQRRQDQQRGSSAQRGYGARWQRARKQYLARNPLCVECLKDGRVVPATVVDHIIPHRGDQELFWSEDNWQSLCKQCHDRKTAKEDGGFGKG